MSCIVQLCFKVHRGTFTNIPWLAVQTVSEELVLLERQALPGLRQATSEVAKTCAEVTQQMDVLRTKDTEGEGEWSIEWSMAGFSCGAC